MIIILKMMAIATLAVAALMIFGSSEENIINKGAGISVLSMILWISYEYARTFPKIKYKRR